MSTRDTGIRCALIGIIAVTLLATSGCGWFRSKKEPYKNAAESRPLEIPPDLDQPKTDPAMRIPDVAHTVAPAPATASTSPVPQLPANEGPFVIADPSATPRPRLALARAP